MMADFEESLAMEGPFRIKPESREIVTSSPGTFEPHTWYMRGAVWRHVPHMKALGMVVSCNGTASQCATSTKQSIWRAFSANRRMFLSRHVPIAKRFKLWYSISNGIIGYRAARWPMVKTSLKAWDTHHNKLAARISLQRPRADETPAGFQVRRAHVLRNHCHLKWSDLILRSHVTWAQHVLRHPESLSELILRVQNDDWMQERRAMHLSRGCSVFAGRTGTRAQAGRPVRWDGPWRNEVRANPLRDPEIVQSDTTRVRDISFQR